MIPSQIKIKNETLALLLGSVFAMALLMIRFYVSESITYAFLAWNLFLAWIPLGFAWGAVKARNEAWSSWICWASTLGWLLFFPNAPYILTDLGHLARVEQWNVVPLGFDVVMLFSFVINGFALAFLSLFLLEEVLAKRFGGYKATTFSLGVLCLTGFGMYLGRFLRWNSWDVFSNPISIFIDTFSRIAMPTEHPRAWGFTLLYAGILIITYVCIRLWRRV